jgi:hypothetical protein
MREVWKRILNITPIGLTSILRVVSLFLKEKAPLINSMHLFHRMIFRMFLIWLITMVEETQESLKLLKTTTNKRVVGILSHQGKTTLTSLKVHFPNKGTKSNTQTQFKTLIALILNHLRALTMKTRVRAMISFPLNLLNQDP